MLKNLKFPLLYVVEAVIWLPLLAAFYGVSSFLAAKPLADLDLQGKSLPVSWEAAVPNHDGYVQGYIVFNHPTTFGVALFVLLGSVLLLYRVHSAQVAQRKRDGASHTKAHAMARGFVIALLAIVGYLFLTQILVSVPVVVRRRSCQARERST